MSLLFTVPSEPRATQRPRVTKNGTFTPEASLTAQALILTAFLKERERLVRAGAERWLCEPDRQYRLDLRFQRGTYAKADADNLIKTVLDGLNGHAFPDDSQVTRGGWEIDWAPRRNAAGHGYTLVRLERLALDMTGNVLPLYSTTSTTTKGPQ